MAWQAGKYSGGNVDPGSYQVRVKATGLGGTKFYPDTTPPGQGVSFSLTKEDTTTTYGGPTSGHVNDVISLSVTVADLDGGTGTYTAAGQENGIFSPDTNLVGANVIHFTLYQGACPLGVSPTQVGSTVDASIDSSGATTGAPTMTLPAAAGSYCMQTSYDGNVHYASSSDLDTITVTSSKHPTTTSVSCSPASIAVNDKTTCTATVTDTSPSGATTPSGTVDTWATDVTSGGTFSASSCTLSEVSTGIASCSVDFTPALGKEGTQKITAAYVGDTTHATSNNSSSPFKLTVTKRTTSTSVSCTPSPVILNGTTVCTATVTDTNTGTKVTPTGTVSDWASDGSGTFYTHGTTTPATSCTLSDGICQLDYVPSAVGMQNITASYGGDTDHFSSTSSAFTLTVKYNLCLLYDPLKSHKAGSTAPLKLYLCDANGVDVSSSGIIVNATSLVRKDNSASGILEDSGYANSPDNNFRYDSTLGPSGGYIFNLSTKSPSPALGQTKALATGTWVLNLTVDGAGGYSINFDVK